MYTISPKETGGKKSEWYMTSSVAKAQTAKGEINFMILENLALHVLDNVLNMADASTIMHGFLFRPSYIKENPIDVRDDYGEFEQVKWVKEQIEHENFCILDSGRSFKQALFQGLMSSLFRPKGASYWRR